MLLLPKQTKKESSDEDLVKELEQGSEQPDPVEDVLLIAGEWD